MKILHSDKGKKGSCPNKKGLKKKCGTKKLVLNIIGSKKPIQNEFLLSNMENHTNMFDCDILKTRRIITNSECRRNQARKPILPPINFSSGTRNIQQVNQAESCVVRFSNTYLTQSTSRFTNVSSIINQHSHQHNMNLHFQNVFDNLPLFHTKNNLHVKSPNEDDDDVVCVDTSQADNSVVAIDAEDSQCITIDSSNQTDILSNSVLLLNKIDERPDLSKFDIVVSNTVFSDTELMAETEVNNDNSVIFIGSENNVMETTDSVSTQEQKNKRNCNVITIDDDTTDECMFIPLSTRRLNIPKANQKDNLIYKKKDKRRKLNLKPFTSISDNNLQELCKVAETQTSKSQLTVRPPQCLESKSDKSESNMYNSEFILKTGLREIIIDGSNVALGHSNGTSYSIEGLQIVIDYFLKRGHKVRAFVPKFRINPGRSTNEDLLRQLVREKYVILTPSRAIQGRRITPYDDRYIIQYATACEGIVVSSDCYRDLMNEKPEWRNTIENRLLMPTWIDNILMFPEDPLGRFGPNLTEFLKFPSS